MYRSELEAALARADALQRELERDAARDEEERAALHSKIRDQQAEIERLKAIIAGEPLDEEISEVEEALTPPELPDPETPAPRSSEKKSWTRIIWVTAALSIVSLLAAVPFKSGRGAALILITVAASSFLIQTQPLLGRRDGVLRPVLATLVAIGICIAALFTSLMFDGGYLGLRRCREATACHIDTEGRITFSDDHHVDVGAKCRVKVCDMFVLKGRSCDYGCEVTIDCGDRYNHYFRSRQGSCAPGIELTKHWGGLSHDSGYFVELHEHAVVVKQFGSAHVSIRLTENE